MISTVALVFSLLGVARAQQAGSETQERHPKMPWQQCTRSGCTTVQGSVVLDANWRWLHKTSGYDNCYTGNEWDTEACPDNKACASNCAVDGADYTGTYGITNSGNAMTMKFVTEGEYSTNIGSRVYLMDAQDSKYHMFMLKNKEFTFDVDVKGLPCGLNGALYFVSMDADGGQSRHSGNKAGAKFGTGYCDAQCPHDLKFINGEANVEGWTPSKTDKNAGSGKYGTCCAEMDIWEANSISTAYTPHPCTTNEQSRCGSPKECGDNDSGDRYNGICDKDGCDFNSFRLGEKEFYGPGKTVDTNSKMTVVTQFLTADNTTTGPLSEIRRIYVQNGKVIQNSKVNFPGFKAYDSLTDSFCEEGKVLFGDTNDFKAKGNMAGMGAAMDKGMVLVMSMWADHAAHMLWLDSNYPLDKDPSTPGVARGTCSEDSGDPDDVEAEHPDATVIYSNIKLGDFGTTYTSS